MAFSFLRNLATLEIILIEMKGFALNQFFYMLPLIAAVNGTEDYCINLYCFTRTILPI